MSIEKKSLENYKGHWATVYNDSGTIRDVTYAKGREMAEDLLLPSYTENLKKLVTVKPVNVTVFELNPEFS